MSAIRVVELRKHAITELTPLLRALNPKPTVSYSWKADTRERNQVFTMRGRGETPPASLRPGKTFRNESGSFEVVVHVHAVGKDQETADEQALAYGAVIEDYFAINRTPGITGVNWWVVASYEMDGGPSDRASVSQLIYTVRYDARLT